MTEYLYGPVWYSTVPDLHVNWDVVEATYIATMSELMQRCYRLILSPSAQIYKPTSKNENKSEPTNNTNCNI